MNQFVLRFIKRYLINHQIVAHLKTTTGICSCEFLKVKVAGLESK